MRLIQQLILLLFAISLLSCSKAVESNNAWFRDINVCKKLTGKVLVYPIFVKDKKGEGWSEPDMKEFGDSLQVTLDWLEKNATRYHASVQFLKELHPKVISKGFPQKTIAETYESLKTLQGFEKLNKHYDGIAKMADPNLVKSEVLLPKAGDVKSKERLIAKLRNTYEVESVVLMFIHKPVGIDHFFVTLNSLTNKDVEFMVTTFRSPTVLASQILELFGAAPLMYSKKEKKEEKAAQFIEEHFPNDLMANLGKTIHALDVGAYNAYLLGWTNSTKEEYKYLPSKRKVFKD